MHLIVIIYVPFLKLLTIFDIYNYQLGIFMFKWQTNVLPIKFATLFTPNNTIHDYDTMQTAIRFIAYAYIFYHSNKCQ